jgi:hypothetical protein
MSNKIIENIQDIKIKTNNTMKKLKDSEMIGGTKKKYIKKKPKVDEEDENFISFEQHNIDELKGIKFNEIASKIKSDSSGIIKRAKGLKNIILSDDEDDFDNNFGLKMKKTASEEDLVFNHLKNKSDGNLSEDDKSDEDISEKDISEKDKSEDEDKLDGNISEEDRSDDDKAISVIKSADKTNNINKIGNNTNTICTMDTTDATNAIKATNSSDTIQNTDSIKDTIDNIKNNIDDDEDNSDEEEYKQMKDFNNKIKNINEIIKEEQTIIDQIEQMEEEPYDEDESSKKGKKKTQSIKIDHNFNINKEEITKYFKYLNNIENKNIKIENYITFMHDLVKEKKINDVNLYLKFITSLINNYKMIFGYIIYIKEFDPRTNPEIMDLLSIIYNIININSDIIEESGYVTITKKNIYKLMNDKTSPIKYSSVESIDNIKLFIPTIKEDNFCYLNKYIILKDVISTFLVTWYLIFLHLKICQNIIITTEENNIAYAEAEVKKIKDKCLVIVSDTNIYIKPYISFIKRKAKNISKDIDKNAIKTKISKANNIILSDTLKDTNIIEASNDLDLKNLEE